MHTASHGVPLQAWLPPGPYLRPLETLLLSANRLAQVPPVLAEAASLEVLDLSSNPALELSRQDVQAILSRMPRLSLLLLGKQAALDLPPGMGITAAGLPGGLEWRTPSVAALVALGQALPHLQVWEAGCRVASGSFLLQQPAGWLLSVQPAAC
jgi:hypothetical protein